MPPRQHGPRPSRGSGNISTHESSARPLRPSPSLTALSISFLIAFIASLVLAVIAMLHGVEYTRPKRNRAPSPFFNLPSFAAFGFAYGIVGYSLATRTSE